ncbi:secreted RxLR effector protein 161-like [Rhagoletis pomonella]|uniref:secreted RxLR effector protein 161-like n=1 Tax=Rhagoletis pomonella TaxID=28610 RepID=UPI001780B47F|nr:secreted RxLR effector protein 161-like [Rhagoletis pomonella]
MTDCNPVETPLDPNQRLTVEMCPTDDAERREMKNIPYQELTGSLLFLVQVSRPDICYAVSVLSRFNNNYGRCHWTAAKRVLRYLKGTINKKLIFTGNHEDIKGFCDADWASDVDERKSMSGYVFTMQGAAISWSSKKQKTIALSSTEAEYMSLVSAVQEAIWLRRLERELQNNYNKPTLIFCDNKSAIQLAKNGASSARTKHIEIKEKFVEEKMENGIIEIKYPPTSQMKADVLTKALDKTKQKIFTKAMGII